MHTVGERGKTHLKGPNPTTKTFIQIGISIKFNFPRERMSQCKVLLV